MTSGLLESRQVFWQDFLAASNYNRFAECLQIWSKFFRRYLRGRFSIAKFSSRQKVFGSRRWRVLLLLLARLTTLPFFHEEFQTAVSLNEISLLKTTKNCSQSPCWSNYLVATENSNVWKHFHILPQIHFVSWICPRTCSQILVPSLRSAWELPTELLVLLI